MRPAFRSTLFIAALLVASTISLVAGAALSNTGRARVRFTAIGPAGMKIVGKTSELQIVDDGKMVMVKVPLRHLKTGIGLRDRHMRDKYLEVGRYPDTRLAVARSALQAPEDGASVEGDATGRLTLHGQTHGVRFHYRARNDGGVYHVSGSLRLNMKDYGITVPSYFGVSVKPVVRVGVHFQVADR